MLNALVVIPARLESKRLPNKLLKQIHGKPMIYWTYHSALNAGVGNVVVAVDRDETAKVLKQLKIPYTMTSDQCRNGTERVHEVSKKYKEYEFFVNVQGDEPLLNPQTVQAVTNSGLDRGVFKTAISPVTSGDNSSEVKVALSYDNRIRFASRAAIPCSRDGATSFYKIHGVYLYSRDVLNTFVNSRPGPLESQEQVEQLRCIEYDIPLYGVISPHTERSVDTKIDLEYVRSLPSSKFLRRVYS